MRWIPIICILCATTLEAQNVPGSCVEWGEAREVGQLDPGLIPEASGIEVSSLFPGRLYHVDDSSTRFYVTDPRGDLIQAVSIAGTNGIDVEDLALGPCGETTCLFIADIGDNPEQRDSIEVIVVEEVEDFPEQVSPRHRISLRYPEGPEDAEAMAVDPNGDLFVLVKRIFPEESEPYSELFRLPAESWIGEANSGATLESVSGIDFGDLASTLPGRLVTAMDFSEDGERLLVLTYLDAYEFRLSQVETSESLVEGRDYERISLAPLRQQESVAYVPGSTALRYGTESGGGRSPIMRVECRTR